jgi:hypothetical protein
MGFPFISFSSLIYKFTEPGDYGQDLEGDLFSGV